MALVTTCVVILRYGFEQGAIAAQESVLYLHGTLFMLGAAPTLLSDKHVRVDVFYRNFSPRQQTWVNTLGHTLFTIPICLTNHLWLLGLCRGKLVDHGVFTRTRRYPSSLLLKTLIPAMAVLLLLQAISAIISGLVELSEGAYQ